MPPVPNESDTSVFKAPLRVDCNLQWKKSFMKRYFPNRTPSQVSHEPPDIENLMKLNPKIKPFTNAVPSAVTKKVSRGLLEKHSFPIFVGKSQTKTSFRKYCTKLWNSSIKCGSSTWQKNLLYYSEYEIWNRNEYYNLLFLLSHNSRKLENEGSQKLKMNYYDFVFGCPVQ